MQSIEQLEARRLFASFTAASVADLVADINAANTAGGANTITLAAGTTFKLGAVDNGTDGPNGLPVIAAGDDLTVVGNGDVIQRSSATGTPAFRLFDVAAGGSLTLNNLTLSRGLAAPLSGSGVAEGGAVVSHGTLSLNGVTIQNSVAQGVVELLGGGAWYGGGAFGGSVYSDGVLNVAGGAFQNNQALGAQGPGLALAFPPGAGGPAYGGGLFVGGGTATLTNATLYSNLALGGHGGDGGSVSGELISGWVPGGAGGDGLGGGIYLGAGTLTLRGTTITRNSAQAGPAGRTNAHKHLVFPPPPDGVGRGGGIYVAPTTSLALDAFTLANTKTNTASTSDNDIFGSFTLLA